MFDNGDLMTTDIRAARDVTLNPDIVHHCWDEAKQAPCCASQALLQLRARGSLLLS